LHRLVIHALQTAIQVLHIWLRVSLLLAIALKLSIWTNFELFQRYLPNHTHQLHIPLNFIVSNESGLTSTHLQGKVLLTTRPNISMPMVPPSHSILVSGQLYSLSIVLHVPESPPNLTQGMFKMCLNLVNVWGNSTLIAEDPRSSQWSFPDPKFGMCRLGLLKYSSSLVQSISGLIRLPLFMADWDSQGQILTFPVTFSHQENPINPSSHVILTILSPDLEVYDASVILSTQYHGLRYLMFHHPYITSFLLILMGFYAFIALLGVSGMFRLVLTSAVNRYN
ncbi:hypothetical protein TCAL_15232, partial [Tigriopus californicus]